MGRIWCRINLRLRPPSGLVATVESSCPTRAWVWVCLKISPPPKVYVNVGFHFQQVPKRIPSKQPHTHPLEIQRRPLEQWFPLPFQPLPDFCQLNLLHSSSGRTSSGKICFWHVNEGLSCCMGISVDAIQDDLLAALRRTMKGLSRSVDTRSLCIFKQGTS